MDLKGLKEKISEEKIQELANAIAEEMQKAEMKKNQFKAEKFDDVLENMYQYLLQESHIDDEGLLYFPERFPFTSEDFTLAFEILMEYAMEHEQIWSEEDNPFHHVICQFQYKEAFLTLRTMHGQGTSYQMWLDTRAHEKIISHFTKDN